MSAKPRILILGGGFAGLEAAFLLRMRLGDRVELALVSNNDSFVFRPNSIYIPFGAEPASLLVGLHKPLSKRDIDFHHGSVLRVDPDLRRVVLDDGERLAYDKLVIATGADTAAGEVPGLDEHGATVWTAETILDVRDRFERVCERARRGERSRVVFLVPPNNKCSGPLYEMVLMFETWMRRRHVRDSVITWSTYEDSFIQAFGPRLHDVVGGEFAERGIAGHTGEVVRDVTTDEVRYADGGSRAYDELIAFPPYVSALRYESLPADDPGSSKRTRRRARSSGIRTSTRRATPGTSPSSRRSSPSCRPTRSRSTSAPMSPGASSRRPSTR